MGRKIKESFYNGDGEVGTYSRDVKSKESRELMAVGLFPSSSSPPLQKKFLFP